MTERPHLSVIIPAFNEAGRLGATLAAVAAFLHRPDRPGWGEILVVDDGSHDGTARLAEEFVPPSGVAVRALRLAGHRGKGAAVRQGLFESRGDWVLVSDADLATPIEEVKALFASGAAVAAGSRALRRELIGRRQPPARDVLGRLFNLALRILGLTTLLDTQCGFKLIEGALARRLGGLMRLDGFAFDVELLARARGLGAEVAEVPVRWFHMDQSTVRPLRHGLEMLRDALRIRWWLWTGG